MKLATIMTILFFCFFAVCSQASVGLSVAAVAPVGWDEFIGRWSPECERVKGVSIPREDKVELEVNSNQIYVFLSGGLFEEGLVLSLESPSDLGRGGMFLQWDEFSKIKPIATMKLVSQDKARFHWLGFYDAKAKARVWVDEPDFLAVDSEFFFRCKD